MRLWAVLILRALFCHRYGCNELIAILFTTGRCSFSLFQQIKDKQLQDEESRDQDDSGNGADIDVQEH